MNPPDGDVFGPLVRRDGDPVFDEQWQAQVLGLAFSLSERGLFSPGDWSQALGRAHRELLRNGHADTPATYYEAAVRALEGLLAENGASSLQSVDERTEAWRAAYLATPHGQPVELATGLMKSER